MFERPDPLYVQIAQKIRAQVLSGALAEEEQVMSTTQYATTSDQPRNRAKAFTGLVDEGVLYKRRGLGMFVAPGARERILTDKRKSFFEEVVDPARRRPRSSGSPPRTSWPTCSARTAGVAATSPPRRSHE